MSIVAYTGLPGSGKSYGVVENVILPALKQGRTVVTNIPLNHEALDQEVPGNTVISFDRSVTDAFWNADNQPAGAVFVIDECWRFWPSGMKANNIPERVRSFFTEHRHVVGEDGFSNEIVLVTQDLKQVCTFVRDLVEETFRSVKLTAIGAKKKFRIDVYEGAAIGQKPTGQPIRQMYGKYKADIYKFYQSHTQSQTGAAGTEQKADDRGSVLKSGLIKLGLPIAGLFVILSLVGVYRFFHHNPDEAEAHTVPLRAGTATAAAAPPKPQLTAEQKRELRRDLDADKLPLSPTWRIVGQINNTLILENPTHGDRYIPATRCAAFRQTFEQYCVLNGHLVTWYSAKQPQQPNDPGQLDAAMPSISFNKSPDG
ncbi:zonular occludens toxin domain-containing protein [Mangrovitalea sediminis]|uniref:zonular occludens toxin domain-containing protein n=1 Tax=Mangrovitalea sediminis TaxID=1982043 RepID=UPI000BE5B4F6|nr:zonular occludens toxin domain-containing protein [Mangrovitalea sediminis]